MPLGELSSMTTTAWPAASRWGRTCTSPSPTGSCRPALRRFRPKVQRTWSGPVMKVVVTAYGWRGSYSTSASMLVVPPARSTRSSVRDWDRIIGAVFLGYSMGRLPQMVRFPRRTEVLRVRRRRTLLGQLVAIDTGRLGGVSGFGPENGSPAV